MSQPINAKKRAAIPRSHAEQPPAVSPSYLYLHFHPRLERHLVPVILNHHSVQVSDDQVVVEPFHLPVFVQHALRHRVPRAAEKVVVAAAGAVVRLCTLLLKRLGTEGTTHFVPKTIWLPCLPYNPVTQKMIRRIRFAKNTVFLFALCFFGFQRLYSPEYGCFRNSCEPGDLTEGYAALISPLQESLTSRSNCMAGPGRLWKKPCGSAGIRTC